MSNIIRLKPKTRKSEHSSKKIPACYDCKYYDKKGYSVPACVRNGSPAASTYLISVCRGQLFEPKLGFIKKIIKFLW